MSEMETELTDEAEIKELNEISKEHSAAKDFKNEQNKFRMRVLFTGRNNVLANSLAKQAVGEYNFDILQCSGTKDAVASTVGNGRPHVVIICLNKGESRGTVWIYDSLKKYVEIGRMHVIVVGNIEENNVFKHYTELPRVTFIKRPVNLIVLLDKIKMVEEEIVRSINSNSEFIEEFVREADTFVRKHILVVDDDRFQLMYMRDQLAEFYKVTVASNGVAARKCLRYGDVDMIFLDYVMPGEDGPTVLKSLREDPQTAAIPVVFLTSMTDRETVLNLINNLKPQGYLVKPSSKAELVCKAIEILG